MSAAVGVMGWPAEAYLSWWAARSSKPLSGSHCRWWVRFPSASATCGFALYGACQRLPSEGLMISACHSRAIAAAVALSTRRLRRQPPNDPVPELLPSTENRDEG